MITYGVIGSGAWGSKVIKAIRALGYDVRVCNRSGEYEDQSVCRDYRKLIPEVDIVWVATHPNTNCEIAAFALEHNKLTVVEKPVAFTSQQVAGLVRASKAKQVPLIVDYVDLFNYGLVRFLSEYPNANHLTVALQTQATERDYSAWWDMGSHAVAVALYLFERMPYRFELSEQRPGWCKPRKRTDPVEIFFGGAHCALQIKMGAELSRREFHMVDGPGKDAKPVSFVDDGTWEPLQMLVSTIARLHLTNEYWTNGDLAVEVTDVLERLHKLLPQP